MQETRVPSLGQEDPLGKGTAIHFSILDWRIPWTEKPAGLQSMGLQIAGYYRSNLAHTRANGLYLIATQQKYPKLSNCKSILE